MNIDCPSYKVDAMHGMTVWIAALLNGRVELCSWMHDKFGEQFVIVADGRAYDVGVMIGDEPCLNDACHAFYKLVKSEESRLHASAIVLCEGVDARLTKEWQLC